MIFRPLLPDDVRLIEARLESLVVAAGTLHADEEAHAAVLGPHRALEFRAGRHLARRLLIQELGREPAALLPRASGAPDWPDGTQGSITHHDGLIVVAITRGPALGIDLVRIEEHTTPPPRPGFDGSGALHWAAGEACFKAMADDDPGLFSIEDFVLRSFERTDDLDGDGVMEYTPGGRSFDLRTRSDGAGRLAAVARPR